MDIVTFVIAVVLGYLGIVIFGSLLNWPDAGAVFAIAFVGARIVKILKQKSNGPESPDGKNQS